MFFRFDCFDDDNGANFVVGSRGLPRCRALGVVTNRFAAEFLLLFFILVVGMVVVIIMLLPPAPNNSMVRVAKSAADS